MNWGIALGVAIVVVVLGGIAAVLWWRLANKAAPYDDTPTPGSRPRTGENVVVIKSDGSARD